MKTSKKLLSLFLAMVMIITSCSVGFTAFADSMYKGDTNDEYWSDGTDAETAFKSLNDLANAYVPQLLNIEAVKNLLEDNLGMTVTDNTTISDVVAGASPLLLGALGGTGDKNSVIGVPSAENIIPSLNYSYLEDEDATMTFYALYKFCDDNKNEAGDLGEYCKDTLTKLNKLKAVYTTANEKATNDFNESMGYVGGDLFNDIMMKLGEEGLDMTPENINNVEIDGVKVKDMDEPRLNYFLQYVKASIKGSAAFEVNGLGEAIFAVMGDPNYMLAQAQALIKSYDANASYDDGDLLNAYTGDTSSPAYGPMVIAAILATGLYTEDDIKAEYVTDEQVKQMSDDLVALQTEKGSGLTGNEIKDYIKNASPLSDYAKAYVGDNYVAEFFNLALAGDVDGMKAFASSNFSGKTYIEEVNYMVPSRFVAVNLTNVYGEKEINLSALYPEICRYFEFIKPETDKASYDYDDYKLPPALVVEAVNSLLNKTVGDILDPNTETGAMVDSIIGGLLESDVALFDLVNNIWINLYNKPIETIVNLIPSIVILLDELIVPIVFNEGAANQTDLFEIVESTNLLGLMDYSQAAGSDIGIGSLAFDLNKVVPAILHWLVGDTDTAIDLVGHYTGSVYDNEVPKFTNIYIADKALYGAHLNGGLAKTMKNGGTDATVAEGVDELVTEIATFGMEVVDEYLAEHKNDARYKKDNDAVVTQRGLNNLFVALPQILNGLGQKFVEKYGIDSDWTYTYSGKIVSVSRTFNEGTFEQLQNKTLEDFKATATLNDPNEVLDQFVNILIGNWINGLLDLVNDTIMDDSNKITSKLLLVQNLLEALGGFGEKSIITDVVNGLFQLKRSDVATFTLKKRDTGFVGFSNESGFFLLSNLQYTKSGQDRGIIPLVMTLINGTDDTKTSTNSLGKLAGANAESKAPTLAASKSPKLVKSSTDYKKLLTKENIKASQDLVDLLDKLLSSLLANTSLNGFDWDKTDNILSSAVTFASAYFGKKNTEDIVKLLNNYLWYITGENDANPSKDGKIGYAPTKSGNVDKKKVYTSANLSNLVIQTYSLVENIVDYLFYNSNSGLLTKNDPNKLIADALYGIVSPDAVAIRMDSYPETAKILMEKKRLNWNSFKLEISANNKETGKWSKDYLKYGFKDGNKTAFYDALGESLSGVAAIVGALLASGTGYYENILYPVLSSVAKATGADGVMSPQAFIAAKDSDRLIKGIITPLGNILAQIYDAPLSFIINLVKGIAGVLDDKSVKGIINGAIDPINGLLKGAADVVKYLSPTFAKVVSDATDGLISISLPEKNVIVTLVNGLIADIDVAGTKLGKILTLPIINWSKLANAKSTGEALLLIYAYLVDAILDSSLLSTLIDGLAPGLVDILNNLSAAQVFTTLRKVLAVVQSPTEVYWTFSQYAGKIADKFTYPTTITAKDADKAVGQLDDIVANVFPLLNGLGVTDIEGLDALVNDKLFTNAILTTIATALYGALNSNSTVVDVLRELGIDVTTKGVANYLTNKKFGNTYSSAAATLRKTKDWKKVKSLNWGFKDGSAKAEQGFINGLAAILRPLNDVLSIFLAEGSLDLTVLDLQKLISSLDVSGSTKLGETDKSKSDYQYGCTLKYTVKKGVLTLKFNSNVRKDLSNVLKIDLKQILKDLQGDLDKMAVLDLGTNGYESAIIPLLEAFMCKDVKTYKQYLKDYNKAKDNLLIDVLNPVFGLVDDVLKAPFDTVTKILPNVAYYIDSNGIGQLVGNLLAPITAKDGIVGVLAKNGLNVDKLIKEIAGKSLGKIVTDAIGLKGVKLNLEITHLERTNIQDIVLPLVRTLLKKNKIDIKIPDFSFATIASHGTIKVVKSAAKNADGKYTTRRVIANQGEVLVAVLRYVADVLITNASALNKLLGGIDAIKKNATIKNILGSVFATIGTAAKDDIVRAVFYFLMENATDSFFDYRNFTYKDYDFSFGEMDEDFCRTLAPMLDGLVSGLLEDKGGLLGLIGDLAYKDDVISSIACGLYGAIEGVKISDDIGSLTHLLAMTDIDFTTGNVASLLVNKDYGRTYESAAATIRSAGSWAKVNKESLKWGVKDRDTFLNALVAVLRPLYGVLDVLLNDASLNIFNLVKVPGSDGYTSTIVPLLEAFGCYNIKSQYQYREDCFQAYDSILLDVINPLWDKVEDILNAPIEMLADILPNLSLFFANDGLLQIIDNLLTPISALLNALKPIVNINDLLKAAGLDINALIAKAGLNLNINLDIYDLKATLKPLIGADNVVGLLNTILGIIKIGGSSLGIELPAIDWFKLASHGEVILDATSQVASYGSRIYVKSDQDETLIAVLRFLIDTINYKGNYDAIVGLVTGLLGDSASDSISDVIGEVLGMLQGDSDEVIANLVDLLKSIAG